MDNQDLTMTRRLQGKDEQIADLLEALEEIYNDTISGKAGTKDKYTMLHNIAKRANKAIRKAKENRR